MDKRIVVNLNLFIIQQSIYLPNGQICYGSFHELAEMIPALCYENEVYDVLVRGQNEYVKKLILDVEKQEISKYKDHKINIKGVNNE
jgi:hypothetical protein